MDPRASATSHVAAADGELQSLRRRRKRGGETDSCAIVKWEGQMAGPAT